MKHGALRSEAGQPEEGAKVSISAPEKALPSVIITDLAGRITHWNKRAEEMRGWKREEVLGKPIFDVMPPESRELADAIMKKIAQSGSWTGEFEAIRKDGTRFQTLSNDAALEDSNGRMFGIIDVSVDITERNEMEKRLRESEEKFRGIAERSFEGIFTIDANGIVTYASPTFMRIFGFDPTEVIGKSLARHVPESEPELERIKLLQAFADITSGKTVEGLQFEARRKGGTPIFVEVNVSPILDKGRVVEFQGVVRDITERKQMEKRLRESEEKFRGIAERSFDGIFTADAKGVYTYVSPAFAKLFGLDPSEMTGKSVLERAHLRLESESELSRFLQVFKDVSSGKSVEASQFEIRSVDGSLAFVEANASPVFEGGKVIGVQAVVRDVTERKKMEKRLHESEEKFRGIADRSFDGIFIIDNQGNTNYVSPSLFRLTGFNPEELEGLPLLGFIPESSISKVVEAMGKVFEGQTINNFEVQGRRKDGSKILLEVNAAPVFDAGHSVTAIQGVVRDVTERNRAEETKRMLASVVQATPLGSLTVDMDGTISAWNPAAERIFGYSAEEIIGKSAAVLSPRSDAGAGARVLERLKKTEEASGTGVKFEGTWARKDGSPFNFSLHAFPIKDERGETLKLSGFFSDITEQKAAEEKIRNLQEARSKFISAATHELKTPLVSIKGYSDLAASGSLGEVSKPLEHGLDVVRRNVDRMLNLIQELLEIERMDSGKVEISKQVVNLTDVIRESIDNLRPIMEGKQLEIDVVFPEAAPHVMGEKVRLDEVMDNLLVNAIKFTPGKGKLRVVVTEEAGLVRVSVADKGIGISPTNLQNLFEPFSKIPKSGSIENQEIYGLYSTGLGLAVTKRLIELHGGQIWAESPGEGQGSTFSFTLPSISQ